MTAHRADIHNLLQRAAGDTPIRLGANCIGADSVNNTAVARFADGSAVEADIVVGSEASARRSAPSISAPTGRASPR